MKTISLALLAAALVATASAGKHSHHHNSGTKSASSQNTPAKTSSSSNGNTGGRLSSDSFVESDTASQYRGFKVDVQFYTAPSVDEDLAFMHALKPAVVRMNNEAVDFHPHMVVVRGQDDNCRNPDGSAIEHPNTNCADDCRNAGRYCDYASFSRGGAHGRHHHHDVGGGKYVEQSARSSCVWEEYGYGKGSDDLYKYFQYHDAMKGTGCDQSYSESCLEQVSDSVGFDNSKLDQCVGNLADNVDEQNQVLERELNSEHRPKSLPALFVKGEEIENFAQVVENGGPSRAAGLVLRQICDALPKNGRYPKPPICDFCLNWCPNLAGNAFNMETCLWQLECGNGANYDQYAKIANIQKQEEGISAYLHIIATVLAIILAIGLTALTCMAIRVWRTKMIIDRYVKEQQAMNSNAGGGVNGHRDPAFFPEDNELDLDLEPALQYSDHINVPPSSSPPSRANFLPQLT